MTDYEVKLLAKLIESELKKDSEFDSGVKFEDNRINVWTRSKQSSGIGYGIQFYMDSYGVYNMDFRPFWMEQPNDCYFGQTFTLKDFSCTEINDQKLMNVARKMRNGAMKILSMDTAT